MLKILRKKGFAKVMIWIIAIVIIISFGFMATAYLLTGSGGSSYAGRIFNKKISYMDYDAAYRATVIDAMLQYGSQFGKIRSYLNIDAQTWDRLILIHDVNRKRISATDEEVVETIQGSPYFQRDGQFDSLLYRDTMRYFFRIEDRTFEEVIRDKVRFAKLYDQITGDITATETEVLDAFRKKNERIQVSYIFIAPEKFEKDVKVTDELTKTYFEANSEQFRVPSSINVEYITLAFPQNTMIETINTDGEEPVSSSEDDQEELKEPIRTKANALFEDLLIDPKFEVLAQKEQLEIKTSGFFSQAEPNLSLGWPFESLNRIFSLQVGEISEPFETSNGMVIAKIKERKDSYIPEYKEIRAKVKEAVIKEESKRIAATKSQEYLEQLKTEMNKTQLDNFAEAARALDMEIHQTPVFTQGQYLPKIGIANEFQSAAFMLNEDNNVSDVVSVPNGYAIIHLDGKEPADESHYEEQRQEIADALINERKNRVFTEYMTNLRLEANLEDNISRLRQEQQINGDTY